MAKKKVKRTNKQVKGFGKLKAKKRKKPNFGAKYEVRSGSNKPRG